MHSATIGSSQARGRSRDLDDAADGSARAGIFPVAPVFDRFFRGFFFLLNVQLWRMIHEPWSSVTFDM
jgi:hypothetical protein